MGPKEKGPRLEKGQGLGEGSEAHLASDLGVV